MVRIEARLEYTGTEVLEKFDILVDSENYRMESKVGSQLRYKLVSRVNELGKELNLIGVTQDNSFVKAYNLKDRQIKFLKELNVNRLTFRTLGDLLIEKDKHGTSKMIDIFEVTGKLGYNNNIRMNIEDRKIIEQFEKMGLMKTWSKCGVSRKGRYSTRNVINTYVGLTNEGWEMFNRLNK